MPRDEHYQRERGHRQEERILAAIAEQAMSAEQIAAALHMSVESVHVYMHRLCKCRIRHAHIERYEPSISGRPKPFFRYGNKPDAVYVRRRVAKPKQPPRVETMLAKAIELLATPKTTAELGQAMLISTGRARAYVQMLRDAKQIYIKEWRRPPARGDLAPVYVVGKRKDAPKRAQTRAERYKIERANEERYEKMLAKRRADYHAEKAVAKPNSWLSALGL